MTEEGTRTPKELPSPPSRNTTKPSPRACPEQLDFTQHDKKHIDKHTKKWSAETGEQSTHGGIQTINSRDFTVEEGPRKQEDNLNNSADREEHPHAEVPDPPASPTPHLPVHRRSLESRQHSGVISSIIHRVFSGGRARANQVTPIVVTDSDVDNNNRDRLARGVDEEQ